MRETVKGTIQEWNKKMLFSNFFVWFGDGFSFNNMFTNAYIYLNIILHVSELVLTIT